MPKNAPPPPASPFAPERLDPVLSESLEALTRSLAAWSRIEPLVTDWIESLSEEVARSKASLVTGAPLVNRQNQPTSAGNFVRELMADLTTFLERFSKISLNLTKALDEGSRLRSFLGGGPDSRPDLATLSDKELLDILVQSAVARGLGTIIADRIKAIG
jgi:hypothetical protein